MAILSLSDSEKHMSKDGLTVQEATILQIQDVSNQQLKFMAKPCELGVTLKIDIGRTFTPEMTIAGVFKRDDKGMIIGWGGAFVVADFFRALGEKVDLDESNPVIPGEWLTNAVGKTILKLSYTTGKKDEDKFKYSDWMQIGKVSDGPEKLMARFRKSAANGYPRNYVNPENMGKESFADVLGSTFSLSEVTG